MLHAPKRSVYLLVAVLGVFAIVGVLVMFEAWLLGALMAAGVGAAYWFLGAHLYEAKPGAVVFADGEVIPEGNVVLALDPEHIHAFPLNPVTRTVFADGIEITYVTIPDTGNLAALVPYKKNNEELGEILDRKVRAAITQLQDRSYASVWHATANALELHRVGLRLVELVIILKNELGQSDHAQLEADLRSTGMDEARIRQTIAERERIERME